MPHLDVTFAAEFDRQVRNLVDRGYPSRCDLSEMEFVALFEPLRPEDRPAASDGLGQAAFVIVPPRGLLRIEDTVPRMELAGKPGFLELNPRTPADFAPIVSVAVPEGSPYICEDIDTGAEFLNVTPEDALAGILRRGRFPLTIEEGVAVVTHFPALLRKNACFSLPGSRGNDQRVPAIWISGGRPRLGWCWDRNPHTWLGSASCARRRGAG